MMAHEDNDGDRHDQRQAQQQAIRDSGWPVTVVPLNYDGPTVGDNILLGWSDTREAPRAGHDLLTVTKKGTKVKVLRVGKKVQDTMSDSDAIDLSEMLSRPDLKPTLEHREAKGDTIAEALNNVALESGADLIAKGATTHALLRDAKLPILIL
jgi:nucleotide-binding universal stress UspA family protein